MRKSVIIVLFRIAFVLYIKKQWYCWRQYIAVNNQPKTFEFLETYIVNSSTKYHWFLMYRSQAIRKRTMVTHFPAQLKVYIHPKTLRFSALFWMGRVSRICRLWKNYSLKKVDIYTQKTFLFRLENDTKMKRVRHLCHEL